MRLYSCFLQSQGIQEPCAKFAVVTNRKSTYLLNDPVHYIAS